MFVLIGVTEGSQYDESEIPALFWNNIEDALKACSEIFESKPPLKGKYGDLIWFCQDFVNFKKDDATIGFGFPNRIINRMYTSYDGGCKTAVLREIKEGIPFLQWNQGEYRDGLATSFN